MRKIITFMTLVVSGLVFVPIAFASSNCLGVGQSFNYNVFTFKDLTQNNVDSEGRVAVGRNATLSNFAVGNELKNSNSTRDDLIVNGNLDYKNGQVANGNIKYNQVANIKNVSVPNGIISKGEDINFNDEFSNVSNISGSTAKYVPNGQIIESQQTLKLIGTDSKQNIFNITSFELANLNNFVIDAPITSTVIVNISGTSVVIEKMSWTSSVAASNVLINIPNATSLNISQVGIIGSIIAPIANVNFNNGQINGTIVVNSLHGTGETHNFKFKGCIVQPINVNETVSQRKESTATPVMIYPNIDVSDAKQNEILVQTGKNLLPYVVAGFGFTFAVALLNFSKFKK